MKVLRPITNCPWWPAFERSPRDQKPKGIRECFRLFDEEGFTTVSMAIAMVLVLALLLSAAQIYRLQTQSAAIQEVADVSALAAENVVAEFMIAVRVCDAVMLSMSLLALTIFGISIVTLCIPGLQGVGAKLVEAGSKILNARDSFGEKATEVLNRVRKALPFLSAANAALVAASNSTSPYHSYLAWAVVLPHDGDEIVRENDEASAEVQQALEENKDALAQSAQASEEAAIKANEAKQTGYMADCGRDPMGCMKERAFTLAGLSGTANPAYASVDSWSFAVALQRAQSYYQARCSQEVPVSGSVEERSNSALRSIFYAYASEELATGYAREHDGRAELYFPLLPRNTEEMRATRLYTQNLFPITSENGALVMHAWSGCPKAGGASGLGSIAMMESGGFSQCSACHFKASDLGKVGAASSSISNGFEYYYRQVAEAAQAYQDAMDRYAREETQTKNISKGLIDSVKDAMKSVAKSRITLTPPGAYGAVALVADMATNSVDQGLSTPFVTSAGSLGVRAAVSAATLVEEPAGEAGSVIASLLEGLDGDAGIVGDAGRVVLDAWNALLSGYNQGIEGLQTAVENGLSSIPLMSQSGLGRWASSALHDAMEDVGLAPAELDALKPVLVNSGRVASADLSTFSVRYLSIKNSALSTTESRGGIFGGLIERVENEAQSLLDQATGGIEIACVELPIGGISIPIVLSLPPTLTTGAQGLLDNAIATLQSLSASITSGTRWS